MLFGEPKKTITNTTEQFQLKMDCKIRTYCTWILSTFYDISVFLPVEQNYSISTLVPPLYSLYTRISPYQFPFWQNKTADPPPPPPMVTILPKKYKELLHILSLQYFQDNETKDKLSRGMSKRGWSEGDNWAGVHQNFVGVNIHGFDQLNLLSN